MRHKWIAAPERSTRHVVAYFCAYCAARLTATERCTLITRTDGSSDLFSQHDECKGSEPHQIVEG